MLTPVAPFSSSRGSVTVWRMLDMIGLDPAVRLDANVPSYAEGFAAVPTCTVMLPVPGADWFTVMRSAALLYMRLEATTGSSGRGLPLPSVGGGAMTAR